MKTTNKFTLIGLSFAFGIMYGAVARHLQTAYAAEPVRWNSACYGTFNKMMTEANRLNTKDVQFFSIPSSRNYLGLAGDPYCLIYSR